MIRLTNSDMESVALRYRAGETQASLAECFGVGAPYIHRALKRLNVPFRITNMKLTDTEIEAVVARYRAGETQAQLAECFESSVEAIRRVLRLNGVLARPACPRGSDIVAKVLEMSKTESVVTIANRLHIHIGRARGIIRKRAKDVERELGPRIQYRNQKEQP